MHWIGLCTCRLNVCFSGHSQENKHHPWQLVCYSDDVGSYLQKDGQEENGKSQQRSESYFSSFMPVSSASKQPRSNDDHKSADHGALHVSEQCAARAFCARLRWRDNSCPTVLWLISVILFSYICTDTGEPYAMRVMKAITNACSRAGKCERQRGFFHPRRGGEGAFSNSIV